MLATGVDDVIRELSVIDPATCDAALLPTIAQQLQRVQCWLDAMNAVVVARSAELATAGGQRLLHDADVVCDRAKLCAAIPEVHQALAAGVLSAGHADAIAKASNRLDDDERLELAARAPELVDQAAAMSVDSFRRKLCDLTRRLSRDEGLRHHEKLHAARSVSRWVDRDGMCHTKISLDPELDARLSAAFDAAIAAERANGDDGRSWDQLKADAFLAMVTSTVTGSHAPAELLVLIDLPTLKTGTHDHSVCETYDGQPLPPSVVRRLACEANIIPVVLNGDSRPLDVGRARRLATTDQRRALRRTCAAPDSPVRFGDCDIHHLTAWGHFGMTNLDNLLPLCNRHHHLVHEGRWQPPARAPAA